MKIIAKIYNDYIEKFGIPRQSRIVNNLSKIVFEKEYRVKEAFTMLDEYTHIWLIWNFSESERDNWHATVRPPKLGGNKRVGVFATRSPFRPNPIGLSCVKLVRIDVEDKEGPVLYVEGADLMNGTPIYDIKPYVTYTDCIPDASQGFAVPPCNVKEVIFQTDFSSVPDQVKSEIRNILEQDPHPAYKNDEKTYKMTYGEYHMEFNVSDDKITVKNINKKTI